MRKINQNFLYEIRIRAGQPITVNYKGEYIYFGDDGITNFVKDAIICTKKEVEDIVYSAGKFSVYAVEDQIRKGFISAENGVRVGLAGEYVYTKGQPITIRNISSLCIRVPHAIIGAANEIYNVCFSKKINNLLIISPPGLGKTTILRDLVRIFTQKSLKNVLICDERGEIAMTDTGIMCDVISYAEKKVAFEAGIRAMRPDIIISDEITTEDIPAIKRAIGSGVITIASAHLHSFEDVVAMNMDIFDVYVILDEKKIGKLRYVYNKSGEMIYQNDD